MDNIMENSINKAKIVLISPFRVPILSIGIRLLSAYLKENGHDVRLVFMPTHKNGHVHSESVLKQLLEVCQDADLIGFTLMTAHFTTVRDLTNRIKQKVDTPVIWGGVHVNLRPEECLEHADMICIGEGEDALLETANSIKSGDIYSIDNIWSKRDGEIVKNEIRPLECDLDRFPTQDFDVENHYILYHEHIVNMTPLLLKEHLTKDPENPSTVVYDLITTRNCPHNCTYCNNYFLRKMYKGKGPFVRMRSTEKVIEDIAKITNKFDFFTSVSIKDDVFFVRKTDDIKIFCNLFKEKIGLSLRCILSPMYMDEEKYKALIDAGLISCGVGIQSYNEKTLKEVFKRKSDPKQLDECVKMLDKYPAEPQYHFIIDNPYESKESIKDTLRFIASLPRNVNIIVFSLIPFPGTEIHDWAVADHLVEGDLNEFYNKDWHDPQRKKYYTHLIHLCESLKNKKGDPEKIKKLIFMLSSQPFVILCDNIVFLVLLESFLKARKRVKSVSRKFKKVFAK